jgi:hypothetical protein
LNHISELEGLDLMKKNEDIDFSDFEAIQAHLQEEGDKPKYRNK